MTRPPLTWQRLCALDELEGGRWMGDLPGGDTVLVVHDPHAGLHVVDAHCPHQYAPLLGGPVEDCILTCPIHQWRFDLRTGVSPDSPFLSIRRYDAEIRGQDVWVLG